MIKHTIVIVAAFAAAVVGAADKYMFSADCRTPGSGLRELPSQGVDLVTKRVVVGLHALGDADRARCGWYRYVELPKPSTNEYWQCTNYVFHAGGTVNPVWSKMPPPPRLDDFDKYEIVVNLGDKWPVLKAVIEKNDMMDRWNAVDYIRGDSDEYKAFRPLLPAILGMTDKEIDDLLDKCRR